MTEPFQLLHINIVSAKDLAPVSRSMQTYVVGWINPDRKLTTRVDYNNHNCPEWHDRFTFRVTPKFLYSESSTIDMEIYSQAWLRDTLVGSVRVAIPNLLPTGAPNKSNRRSVALQIRRPSGRPQGILNATVSVVDGSVHSMPLSGVGPINEKGAQSKADDEKNIVLRRIKSEHSMTSYTELSSRPNRSTCKGPEPGPAPGSSLGGSMCNSDVGPSASVVAAAMAKGLYLPPSTTTRGHGHGRGRGGKVMYDDEGSSILQWEDEPSEEGIVTKIERWKMELEKPLHGKGKGEAIGKNNTTNNNARHKHNKHRRSKTEGGRVFRCFGKAYGFEFTIVCGGNNGNDNNNNNNKHNKNKGKKKVQHISSSDNDTNSQSYIIL